MNNISIINTELALKTTEKIIILETMKKDIEDEMKTLKAIILKEMEDYDIKKYENDMITITYIAETEREDFNKKDFQAENPKVYDKYVTFTKVKPSIRIKIHD